MKAVLLAVLAGVCWGVGEVITKSALHTRQVGPLAAVLVRAIVALPVAAVAYVLAARWSPAEVPNWWRTADTSTLVKLIVGPGLLAGAVAVVFFYWAISIGEVSRLKPIAFTLAPAIAVLIGWLVLGETMTARKAAGVALILGGVLLLTGQGASGGANQKQSDPAVTGSR